MKRVVFLMVCMMTVCALFGQTHWTQPTNYLGSVTANSVLVIDGVESVSDQIEIGAFCGDECRGAVLPYGTLVEGHRLYFLSIGGNTNNEVITFRLWDHAADEELEYECQTTLTFVDNMQLGTYPNWFEISFTSPVTTITQTTGLVGGAWNRFSISVEVEDPFAMLDMLKAQLGENGMIIESVNSSTEYYGDDFWFGDLDYEGVDNGEMYLILVSDDCTVELQGLPANPADHPITILPEAWTRIGFPCSQPVSVEDALAGFEAEEGDLIESKDGSVYYYEGIGWFGDFEEFTPGEGYLYYSVATGSKTLIFICPARKK